MHKRLMAMILMMLVAGCTGKTDKSNSQSASADSSTAAAATSPGDWSIEKTTSGIDGDTLTASKMFPFGDKGTTFLVSVTCATGTKTPGMSIESYVGDQKNPDTRSAFAAQSSNNDGLVGGLQPTGRMKIGNDEPDTLALTFHVDPSYSNRIVMNSIFMAPMDNDMLKTKGTFRFPMVVEVTNGVGVFELDIDSSNEVKQVLNACASALKEETSTADTPPPVETPQRTAREAAAEAESSGLHEETSAASDKSNANPAAFAAAAVEATPGDADIPAPQISDVQVLPKIKLGESYSVIRTEMLKSGWKPYHSPDADTCMEDDSRCAGRPEMESCAGTGLANCKFLWRKQEKTVGICTVGEEDPTFSGMCN